MGDAAIADADFICSFSERGWVPTSPITVVTHPVGQPVISGEALGLALLHGCTLYGARSRDRVWLGGEVFTGPQ